MGWSDAQDVVNVGVREHFSDSDLVTYVYQSGATPTEIRAPFSEFTETVNSETKLKVRSQEPNLLVRDADLTETPRAGDRFIRRGITYSVEGEPFPDGTGNTLLPARRVA